LFTGIWHGANWTFIIWGMLYCVFLLLEKYTKLKSFVESHKLIGHIYTMLVVVLLWVIFRAGSAADAIRFIGNMFGFGATSFCDNATKDLLMSSLIPLVIGAIFALPIKDKIYGISTKCEKAFKPIFTVIIIVLSILAICCCVSMGSNESVALYANF
jgi:D-alanyl-lipoteichoic acid acyltransferase DltB (MBOAT superfamily)